VDINGYPCEVGIFHHIAPAMRGVGFDGCEQVIADRIPPT